MTFSYRRHAIFAGAALAALCIAAPAHAGFDADGDGFNDSMDAYPCDPEVVGTSFTPAQGDHGMVMFEDQFPVVGDFDFNDVVVTYNYIYLIDETGRVRGLRATYNTQAVGGAFYNGLALHLPVESRWVKKATRVVGTRTENLAVSSQDAETTVVISNSLREFFGNTSEIVNSLPSAPRLAGTPVEVEIMFHDGVTLDTNGAPYDLFIFRTNDVSHEVHLPQYRGSARMNTALFNTGNDASNGTRNFVTTGGIPFGLHIPTLVAYPLEGVSIAQLYPGIVGFGASGGTNNQDWYVSNIQSQFAYADVNGQGAPAPGFIGSNHVPAETTCIVSWGEAVRWGVRRSIFTYGSTVEPNGDAILTGYTGGAFPNETNQGGLDMFLARYDSATGFELWVHQYGGAGDDTGRNLVTDSAGNIYVTGDTSASMNGQVNSGGLDAFVMKLGPNGNVLWTRLIGGPSSESGWGVGVDNSGNVYVAGLSSSGSLNGGMVGNTPSSFLVKFDSNGTQLWSQHYRIDPSHPSNYSQTLSLSVDNLSDTVYVTGVERRYSRDPNASKNVFLARHRGNDGQLLWVRHVGDYGYWNSSADGRFAYAFGVAVDDFDGSPYITGSWEAGLGVSSWGQWTRATGDTSADAFIAKFNPNGEMLWTYNVASNDQGQEYGEAIYADGLAGRVYFAGRTSGALPGQYNRGGNDYYLASYTYQGVRNWLIQDGTAYQDESHIASSQSTSQTQSTVYLIGNTNASFDSADDGSWQTAFYRHDSTDGAQQGFTVAHQLGWVIGAWSQCTTQCGTGMTTRSVQCLYGDGSVAPDSLCPGERPVASAQCEYYAGCTADWTPSAWSACSATCGQGSQTRSVPCVRSDGQTVESSWCWQAQPESSQSCFDHSGCSYSWQTSAWSSCSIPTQCGTGSQSRSVVCVRSDGTQVADGLCAGSRPASSQSCYDATCTGQSCADLYAAGNRASGRYDIDPDGAGPQGTRNVYCDLSGGGWTNIDRANNRIWLANASQFIQCRSGLTVSNSQLQCRAPFFNDNSAQPLYHYLCNGTDRTADYLLDHVGALLATADGRTGFSRLEQRYDGQAGTSTNHNEYCYVNGQIVRWDDSRCGGYRSPNGNGNCVPGYFTLQR